MSDEHDWLRERLHQGAPERPAPGASEARVDGVRRRVRARARRRTASIAAGVAGAVAAAIVVPLSLGSITPSPTTGPADPPSSAEDLAASVSCPLPGEPHRWAPGELTAAGSPLPAEPAAIRLCSTDGSLQAPADVLTTGTAEIVAMLDDLEPLDRPTGPLLCGGYSGPRWRLLLVDHDRTVRTASGGGAGCGTVELDGVELSGPWRSTDILQAYIQALAEQRSERTAPAEAPEPALVCDVSAIKGPYGRASMMPAALLPDLSAAIVCTGYGATRRVRTLNETDLRVLRTDGSTEGIDDQDRQCRPSPTVRVVGITRWGDRVELVEFDCGRFTSIGAVPAQEQWLPGDDALAVLGATSRAPRSR